MDQDIDDRIPVAFADSKVGTCRSEIGSLQFEFARAVLLPEEWFSQTTVSCSEFVLSYFDEVKLRQAHGIGQILQRQGLLVRDAEQSYLALDPSEESAEDSMNQLQGRVITYRIAVGPHQGRKVFTLQTLPGTEETFIDTADAVAGVSLHASVAVKVNERKKLERICRYISRPAISEKRLSLTRQGKVRYQLKTLYQDGTTHVIFEPVDFIAKLASLIPRPRLSLTRYHGVFAQGGLPQNSKHRAVVIPARRGKGGR